MSQVALRFFNKAGIEIVAMLNKGQMKKNLASSLSTADQFYALAP